MPHHRKPQFNMTEGNIIKQLLLFSWPLFVGNIFQQLYNTVNAIILGNHIGSEALAAVGVFNPVNNLLLGLFTGISTGATVMVSQSFGAKDKQRLDDSILVAIWLTLISGVLLSLIGMLVTEPLLRLIETPIEIFAMAADYARIMFLGLVAIFFYNILSGILRGMGDSIVPLLFLIFSNILNVGLLYLFVIALDIGIRGAAVATIIAEACAGLLTFAYLLRSQKKYGIALSWKIPNWSLGKTLFGIGLPAGLQTSIFSIGFLLQQNLINSFGPVVIAAYTVVTRVDQFAMMPMNSFSIAITTFVGQNVGAHLLPRAQDGIRKTLWLSQAVTVGLVAILFFFGHDVMKLFTPDVEVVATGHIILQTLSAGYVLVNTYVVLSGAVRGTGDTVAPLMTSFFCNVIFRVSIAYLLVHFTHDWRMIFVSIALAWTIASVFIFVYYQRGYWRRKLGF